MDTVTDDVVRVMKLSKGEGVLVKKVITRSTAEAAGFTKGDVLIKIADSIVTSPAQVVRILKAKHTDEKVSYSLIRDKKLVTGKFTTKGWPEEIYAGLDVVYGELPSGKSLLRTIVMRPKTEGKKPALLFVPGVGCYSMDSPLDSIRAEIQLLSHLARKGYVVMKVDKSGTGDSRGIPCDQLDFNTEMEGYKLAFEQMKQLPDVDTANCFILGHSMGGVMAPLIAKTESVKGIIAYGTIGVNFMEYWVNTRKTLADALEMNPVDKDDYIKEQCQCASMLIDLHMKKDEAIKINPHCTEMYDALLIRDYAFWDQLSAINLPQAWQAYSGKVLAMWGSTDFISAREEHQLIAEIVNKAHPGNGTFKEVPNASHGMETATTFAEALNKPGSYNSSIETIMSEWLQAQRN